MRGKAEIQTIFTFGEDTEKAFTKGLVSECEIIKKHKLWWGNRSIKFL